MKRFDLPLSDNWSVSLLSAPQDAEVPSEVQGKSIPATVPGCVHTDLMAAGLIPDPYLANNEQLTHWIGFCDWQYTTHFELSEETLTHERLELAFNGLDTVAEVSLNGQAIGESLNMHVRCRFDAKAHAKVGRNELQVKFASPRLFAEKMEAQAGARPSQGAGSNPTLPHHMMRKMACNFGWDWGPQLLTCGIWRPASIQAWSESRIQDVRPLVTQADEDQATVNVNIDTESADSKAAGLTAHMTLLDPGGNAVTQASSDAKETTATLQAEVKNPQRWWPIGYGDQPLYTLKVELQNDSGEVLDQWSHRIGLRTTELCTDPDPQPIDGLGQGETFHIKVNGKRVFCRGANWIPDDCFLNRVTPERYHRRIDQAIDANMNMLRVWGGGIYEEHAFYEYCDEQGVLVWQDFLLACACYSEDEPFWSWFEDEARDNVARLSRHASLVLWNGCNENIWGTFEWSEEWQAIRKEGKRSWGLGYYLELFPKIMKEVDPSRPYWPGSPYSGSMDREPNANEYGNRHVWDVWFGDGDNRNYLRHFPRFASEFGFQGPCTWPTLERAIPEDEREWLSPTSIQHNKQENGQQLAAEQVKKEFGMPSRFEDMWYLASINQCRALTMGCEWFRALSPWCSGTLYWQLNDCWPVTSWAAIDGDGRPKLLWHATKRFYRPRLITIKPAAVNHDKDLTGAMAVYFHNDSDEQWAGCLRMRSMHVDGKTLNEMDASFDVEPRGTFKLELPESWTGPAGQFIVADTDDDRAWWFFGNDRDTPYQPANFETSLNQQGDTLLLTVKAKAVTRDLCLLADRVNPSAEVAGQLVNLLPGEQTVFEIKGAPDLSLEDLSTDQVLRCVNALPEATKA